MLSMKKAIFLFAHFFLVPFALAQNEPHTAITQQRWSLTDEMYQTQESTGWILRAERRHNQKKLHYHSRPLLLLAQTEHYLIFKSFGGAHASRGLFIIHIDAQNEPSLAYESPDWEIDNVCDVTLESCHEDEGRLSFRIRLHVLSRKGKKPSSLTLDNSVTVSGD